MALNILSDWSDAIDNSRNELVFENKNKSYGAYQIRKGYSRTILISGIIGIVSIFTILAVPAILASAKDGNKEKILSNEQITIDPIADIKEELPPPPPPPPPPTQPPTSAPRRCSATPSTRTSPRTPTTSYRPCLRMRGRVLSGPSMEISATNLLVTQLSRKCPLSTTQLKRSLDSDLIWNS